MPQNKDIQNLKQRLANQQEELEKARREAQQQQQQQPQEASTSGDQLVLKGMQDVSGAGTQPYVPTHLRTPTDRRILHTHTYTRKCVCTHVRMYAHTRTHLHLYLHGSGQSVLLS